MSESTWESNGCTVTLDSSAGVLTVSGTGAMSDYGATSETAPPWLGAVRSCVTGVSLVVGDGVTRIGSYSFSGCPGITDATLSETVTSVGANAFTGCRWLERMSFASAEPPELDPDCGLPELFEAGSLAEVRVPDASYDAYMSAPVWNGMTGALAPSSLKRVFADARVRTPEGLVTVHPRLALRAVRDGNGDEISRTYISRANLDGSVSTLGYVKVSAIDPTVSAFGYIKSTDVPETVVSENEPNLRIPGSVWYDISESD